MMNKKPIYVVTDENKAMCKVIKKFFLMHAIECVYDISNKMPFTNVHIKDFSSNFAKCMFMRGNPEEFEDA